MTVREAMLESPKTMPCDASVEQVRAALSNDHVHMVLLTEGRRLVGTVTTADLPPSGTQGAALDWSTLAGRTVSPDAPTSQARDLLLQREIRRLAVVDESGFLLGLLCLKRRRTGFCSDADVRERSESRSCS